MKRGIDRMELEEPYGAVVTTKEGFEIEVKAKGFFVGYANTWEGVREDVSKLAEAVRRPRLAEHEDEDDEEEVQLRLVEGED